MPPTLKLEANSIVGTSHPSVICTQKIKAEQAAVFEVLTFSSPGAGGQTTANGQSNTAITVLILDTFRDIKVVFLAKAGAAQTGAMSREAAKTCAA